MKLTETIEAAIRVAGTPLKVSGISAYSSFLRTPENITSAIIKPRPAPSELTID